MQRIHCLAEIEASASFWEQCGNPLFGASHIHDASDEPSVARPTTLAGPREMETPKPCWSKMVLDTPGTLQPGAEKTIRRNGQPMAMNNNRDTIDHAQNG